MRKEDLEQKVNDGWSIQDLATEFSKGKATIRYWLKQFNLVTKGKAGGKNTVNCEIDNKTEKQCAKCLDYKSVDNFFFRKERNSYTSYCKQCNAKDVVERETRTKLDCIKYLGNVCTLCNIDGHYSIYDFHHDEPAHKDFSIRSGGTKSFRSVINELDKCILVCANCHHEIHAAMKKVEQGYHNKIKGNTELWNENKLRKLQFKNQCSCQECGYNRYMGSLQIVYPESYEHLRKYNKTHWDEDFKEKLALSKVLCYNCNRKRNSADVTNELRR